MNNSIIQLFSNSTIQSSTIQQLENSTIQKFQSCESKLQGSVELKDSLGTHRFEYILSTPYYNFLSYNNRYSIDTLLKHKTRCRPTDRLTLGLLELLWQLKQEGNT